MNRKALLDARQYETEKQKQKKTDRPSFHVTAPVGWLNDPNGFSLYKGEYHLFFQYHPYNTSWGPMHWGHCKTTDFIHWEHLPAALAPDQEYDQEGCFSGSAVEENGRHILIYTGVTEKKDADGKVTSRQVQCGAAGDGIDYVKWECNPLVTAEQIPESISEKDFRDPKIWKYENTFYMVVGCCNEQKHGRIALLSSADLKEWTFRNMLVRNDGSCGRMWECPDFFELDGQYLLLASPQDMQAKELEFHNGNGAVYIAGSFDYHTCRFAGTEIRSLDYGLDFYAPQTTEAQDGRRIMIAWMQSWDTRIMEEQQVWNGMMTIPRELHMREGRLIQQPVRELEKYYKGKTIYEGITLKGNTILDGIEGRELDLKIEIKGGSYERFEIQLAQNAQYRTVCRYEPEVGLFTFDRTYSGLCRDIVCIRQVKVFCPGSRIEIRMILDTYSAEIFINNGEQVISSAFFTPAEAKGIEFVTAGVLKADIIKYTL